MIYRQMAAAVLVAAMLTSYGSAWACTGAGPNRHAGPITAIDTVEESFTVFDAETGKPITFAADQSLLEKLETVRGPVLVEFEGLGTNLRAIDVQF